MDLKNFGVFCIYTENDEGTLDELVADTLNREYEYTGNVDERELSFRRDSRIRGFKVEREFFRYFFSLLERTYCGSNYVNEGDYAARKKAAESEAREERKRPLLDREMVWKALRLELPEQELNKVCSFEYRLPKDEYYDLGLIIETIHRLMEGRLEVRTFTSWCVVVMRCLEDCMPAKSARLKELYYDIGDYFDGLAFMDEGISEADKRRECLEAIARLKYYDHLISDAKLRRKTPFETDGVITCVAPAFFLNDGKESLVKVCVVDLGRKKINYQFVPECEYDERINFTFLADSEFEALSSEYHKGFSLDGAMTFHYAAQKSKTAK